LTSFLIQHLFLIGMKKFIVINLILLGFLLMGNSCNNSENYYRIAGFTQGTTYHITYSAMDSVNYQPQIDSILHAFDLSLSTYIDESIISKINNNETNKLDSLLKKTIEVASEVYDLSEGAFDITVMPIVQIWGFHGEKQSVPDSSVIDSLLTFVGMNKIKLEGSNLVKEFSETTIDVNAIAQGYSVDIVAQFLEDKGVENYLVEIGGELRTKGKNPKSIHWSVGIDRPEFGNFLPGNDVEQIVYLTNQSLATSGNYRNYFEVDGVKYTHSIDPLTGYPAPQNILSATIVCNDCIFADAMATACMVSGLEKAKIMVDKLEKVEGYFIYADEEGKFQVYYTAGFSKYLED
jgi:thiamine biosynthesis lipoprotein